MIELIKNRKSVRVYTEQKVSKEDIHTILEAGMSGPTACNKRPWSFIVVEDKEMLMKLADCNGRFADPLRRASLGILICADLERDVEMAPGFWAVDCSIATQNMTLAAQALGLGSCWIGTWPVEKFIENQKELFNLPNTIVPHSVLAIGYPNDEVSKKKVKKLYEEDRVHFEKW